MASNGAILRTNRNPARWLPRLGALAVAVASHNCLISPDRDYPVAPARPSSTGGDHADATSGGAGGAADGTRNGGASAGGPESQVDAGGAGSGAAVEALASCASWQARGVSADGQQVIDPDGEAVGRPFTVFCSGMNGDTPLEYLELPHTDAARYAMMNTSTFTKPGDDNCGCPSSLSSSFSKVRFRVADLTVLADDRAYAAFLSDPACHIAQPTCEGERMGFAEAADCRGAGVFTGRAEVDLGDTPFHIAPNAIFVAFGYTAGGSTTISSDRKRASITGGGFCGGYGPANAKNTMVSWPSASELPLEHD